MNELRGETLFDAVLAKIRKNPQGHDQEWWGSVEFDPEEKDNVITVRDKRTGQTWDLPTQLEMTSRGWETVVNLSSLPEDFNYSSSETASTLIGSHFEFVPNSPACGTAFCVAGHAVVLAGAKMIWNPTMARESDSNRYSLLSEMVANDCITEDGTVRPIPDYAREVLGISYHDSGILFAADNTLDQIEWLGDSIYQRGPDFDNAKINFTWNRNDDDVVTSEEID